MLTVPNWHAAHRSHAYQNLARIWNSHGRILGTVLAINFLWVLPWVVVVFRQPDHAVMLTLIAYAPVVLVCYRFGPRFENK